MPAQSLPQGAREIFISASDGRCKAAFESFVITSAQLPRAVEQYDRYKVWAANVGAGHEGRTYKQSLDYRLRAAPKYRAQINSLLDQLHQLIIEAEACASDGNRDQLSSSSDDDAEEQDASDASMSRWSLSDSGDAATQVQHDPQSAHRADAGFRWFSSNSRLEATIGSIEMTVTCLYRIRVRQPASHDRLPRYRRLERREFDIYSHFDRLFVRDAFPAADDNLVTRLGKLVTERRRILRFCQLYNEELQRDSVMSEAENRQIGHVEPVRSVAIDVVPLDTDEHKDVQSTMAPKSSLKATTFRPKEDQSIDLDRLLSAAVSESEGPSSVATTTTHSDVLILPPRPRDKHGDELRDFVCPYCGVLKHIHSDRAWRNHVFVDLSPYVCTFTACTEPDRMFSNREDWFAHESRHFFVFSCGHADHPSDNDISSFRQHMADTHNVSLPSGSDVSQLEVFQRRKQRLRSPCCLCGQTTNHLKHHVGRHLERIALFSILRSNWHSQDDGDQPGGSKASIDNLLEPQRDNHSLTDSTGSGSRSTTPDERAMDTDIDLLMNEVPETSDNEDWEDVKPELQLRDSLQAAETRLDQSTSDSNAIQKPPQVEDDVEQLYVAVMGQPVAHRLGLHPDDAWSSGIFHSGVEKCTVRRRNKLIHLFIIPGFNKSEGNAKTLFRVASLLSQMHKSNQHMTAIIYLHDISIYPMTSIARRDLTLTKLICGARNYPQMVFVSTGWSFCDHAVGAERERELMTNLEDWGDAIVRGSRAIRHPAQGSIIDHILSAVDTTSSSLLLLQREIMQGKTRLSETTVGSWLSSFVQVEKSRLMDELKLITELMQADVQLEGAVDPGKTELHEILKHESSEKEARLSIAVEEEYTLQSWSFSEEIQKGKEPDHVLASTLVASVENTTAARSSEEDPSVTNPHPQKTENTTGEISKGSNPEDGQSSSAYLPLSDEGSPNEAPPPMPLPKPRLPWAPEPRSPNISTGSHRIAEPDELAVMRNFAAHAAHCVVCVDPGKTYRHGQQLCRFGTELCKDIGKYLYCYDGRPYSVIDKRQRREKVEVKVPDDLPVITNLFEALSKGFRLSLPKPDRRPYVHQSPRDAMYREEEFSDASAQRPEISGTSVTRARTLRRGSL